jgi:hypothetical protein
MTVLRNVENIVPLIVVSDASYHRRRDAPTFSHYERQRERVAQLLDQV